MRFAILTIFLTVGIVALAQDPSIQLDSIDVALADIATHAKNYPPTFSSKAQREEVKEKLRGIIKLLDSAVANHPDDRDLLLRNGFANSMGHNLDFEGCAQKSANVYEHLLTLRPTDEEANYHYGAFLGGVGRPKESIEYLLKAVELGSTEAHYSLAISYLMLEDKQSACSHLRIYVSQYPKDNDAKKLLAAVDNDNLKFERKEE